MTGSPTPRPCVMSASVVTTPLHSCTSPGSFRRRYLNRCPVSPSRPELSLARSSSAPDDMSTTDAPSTLLPLNREVRLRLVRERLERGEYETMDVARAVAHRLLRDDFSDADR